MKGSTGTPSMVIINGLSSRHLSLTRWISNHSEMDSIARLITNLIHNPNMRDGRPLTISFCSTDIMMDILSRLGPIETESWTLLGERLIVIDSVRSPPRLPPRPLEPIESSSEDSDDWNAPVDAGNLIPDPELLLRLELEEERNLDRIPSPNPDRIDELNIGVDFNNPFFMQAQVNPLQEANEDLQEIWDEEDDFYSWDDPGYYSDSDYYYHSDNN